MEKELIALQRNASSCFNKGLDSYNNKCYTESVDFFSQSRQLFHKFCHIVATNAPTNRSFSKNIEHAKTALVRSGEMYARSLEKTNNYLQAMCVFADTIIKSEFNEWAYNRRKQYKLTNEEFHRTVPPNAQTMTIEELLEKYARCKYSAKIEDKTNRGCMYNILQQAQNTCPNVAKYSSTETWDMILEEELRAIERIEENNGSKNILIDERWGIVEHILKLNPKDSHPIRHAIYLRKRAALYLLHKGKSVPCINHSIKMLDESIDLLQNEENAEKLDSYMANVIKTELSLSLVTRSLYQFHTALLSFQDHINKSTPSITVNLTVQQLCEKIQNMLVKKVRAYHDVFENAIQDIKRAFDSLDALSGMLLISVDDMYCTLEDIAATVDYLGLTQLLVSALGFMDRINQWREDPVGSISCKLRLARVYIDTGRTKLARGILDEIIIDKADIENKTMFNIISSYLDSQTGKISEAKQKLEQVSKSIPNIAARTSLVSDAHYYLAMIYMMEMNTIAALECARYSLYHRTNGLHTGTEKNSFLSGTHESMRSNEILNYEQCNKIVQIFLQIAHIYEERGYIREAQGYYNQGLLLSFQTFSILYVIDFLANLGDIEKRRHQYSNALQYMSVGTSLWERMDSDDIVRVQCIISMCQLADTYRSSGNTNRARELISEARSNSEKLQPKRLENLHSPTKMKKIVNEDGFGLASVKGMIALQEALLLFAEGNKEDGERLLLNIVNCPLPQREKAIVQHLLSNFYKGTPDARSYLLESLSLSAHIPTHKPIFSATAQYLINKPNISAYLSSFAMGIALNHQRQDLFDYHRKNGFVDIHHSLTNSFEREPALKAFEDEIRNVRWIENFITNLRSDLSVVNLCLSHDYQSIIISRFDKSHDPIVVSAPIQITKDDMSRLVQTYILQTFAPLKKEDDRYRFCKPSQNKINTLYSAMHEFDSILEASKESMEMNKETISDLDRKMWWKRRETLDERLRNLLCFVEYAMLGCWKILLVGEICTELKEKMQMGADTLCEEIRSRVNDTISPRLVALTLSSLYMLTEYELEEILCQTLQLNRDTHREQLSIICRRFYEVFCLMFSADDAIDTSLPSPTRMKSSIPIPSVATPAPSTAVPLITPVRSRSKRAATTTRKRKEVGASSEQAPVRRVRRKRVVGMTLVVQLAKANELLLKRKHTVLSLDKLLQRVPIESIPSLRSNSISRLPSLHLLPNLFERDLTVDPRRVFYLLNPSGDLKETQNRLQDYFKKWDGVAGEEPGAEKVHEALEGRDIFIYCGHGAGERFYSIDQVKRLKKCAVSFLMGCSSGALTENGEYEPTGTVLSYLLAGCPCAVGNLWDVTDKDCDRFTLAMLEEWFKGRNNVTECMVKAREACTMKYLMGAATVCYGLPAYVKPMI